MPHGKPLVLCAKGIERGERQAAHGSSRRGDAGRRCPRSCPAPPSRATSRGACRRRVTIAARMEVGAPAAGDAGPCDLPALCERRRTRCGARRRNEERLCHRSGRSSTGWGLGESARAALIARSFAELSRLGAALGARPDTPDGPVGAGRSGAHRDEPDLAQFQLRPRARPGAARRTTRLAEGVETAPALVKRARAEGRGAAPSPKPWPPCSTAACRSPRPCYA